jgi:hypothetical protein
VVYQVFCTLVWALVCNILHPLYFVLLCSQGMFSIHMHIDLKKKNNCLLFNWTVHRREESYLLDSSVLILLSLTHPRSNKGLKEVCYLTTEGKFCLCV